MPIPSPELAEIARRLLRHETSRSPGPDAEAVALERACTKLHDELEGLVGPGGASALIRRAEVLARRDSDVPPREKRERIGGKEDETEGVAVLAHLLGLLVNLLGEELGLRPVYKAWPHLASGNTEPSPRESRE